MTPAQLRAFASTVRHGSVKDAAQELGVSESAVSMHVASLRKSLGDDLFHRTSSGLAFTPGGLRLASRAVEILGLQDRTVTEVGEAAKGRRILRLGASSLFAELAAPGLIELFTKRAKDLEVELSVHSVDQFEPMLIARALDVAIGPDLQPKSEMTRRPFLAYDVHAVASPEHPLAGRRVSAEELSSATWLLGPAAIGPRGVIRSMVKQLKVPEHNQRIFQSEAAALEETKRGGGLCLATLFSVTSDIRAERLVKIPGPSSRSRGTWTAMALPQQSGTSAMELLQFVGTPRATQAMLRGAGTAITHFRPSIYVTLWN